ncbi:MAG: glycosyltransferase family 2 protein [Kiritimatiellales bacterium]|nr:glycosyltransferase family 2 protein [Kiritimatiellota bacterium]MBL7011637.1 glycosyltransferase family 2 protein [Kiritimatiellales bacterium]
MKLSIIIPAHNEEHRLPPMLEAYAVYFQEKYGNEAELIVVPNFCEDRTAEVARAFAERFPNLKVLDDPGYVGKGGAVVLGAQAAEGDLIGFVDADGATSPEAFDDLAEKISVDGCIIASRWLKESKMSPKQPLSRRVASRCFNLMVRVMFGLRVTDTQCGAKVFRREVLQQVMRNMGVTNWAFDVDMLFQVKRLGASIREVPTIWNDVAGSKIQVCRSSVQMFVAMVRLRMFYSPLRFMIPLISRAVGMISPYRKR